MNLIPLSEIMENIEDEEYMSDIAFAVDTKLCGIDVIAQVHGSYASAEQGVENLKKEGFNDSIILGIRLSEWKSKDLKNTVYSLLENSGRIDMEPTCVNCRWFSYNDDICICRRFPPVVCVIAEGPPRSFFTKVRESTICCGEFKGKITEG